MSRPSHSAWASCSASAFAASSAKALAMPVRPRAFSRSRVGWVNMSFSFSVVVAGAADIGMVDGLACRRARRRRLIETLVEDGAHRAVGPCADFQGTAAGGVDPFPAKAVGETDDAQAGAKALLGMRPIGQDLLAQQRRVGADGRGFPFDALARPIGETAMRRGHVLGHRGVPAIAA